MIVCSCAVISSSDIERAIDWMRASDPHVVITPGRVYRALGKSPDCGGCIRLFVESMRSSAKVAVPVELRALRAPTGGDSHEGRPQSHRVSQQVAEA